MTSLSLPFAPRTAVITEERVQAERYGPGYAQAFRRRNEVGLTSLTFSIVPKK